ncbi:MAG: alpha-L-rhamnosidase, partial [Kiritimatiellae bacterium]|nr:alpha-L-rhamnosidase [Kiritimatiellia bacterium]
RDYWGGMLDMGATSFWEDFNLAWTNNAFRIDSLPVAGKKDVHGDYGEFCYTGFRHSLCHGWSSGPAAWCIHRVLGIEPRGVGCKTFEVKPNLGDLAWAEGAYALPDGRALRVRAERRPDGTVKTTVDAPAGIKVLEKVKD